MAIPIASHPVTIDHKGRNVSARYDASVSIETRQIGVAMSIRPGTQRCSWRAVVKVGRHVEGSSLPARIVATDTSQQGSIAGDCRQLRTNIEREVARRAPAIQQRVAAIAEQDRDVLLAEVNSTTTLAGNG
ncbi:MAG: hypothetical protein SFV20_14750 [Sphingopyxis sp.]|nr:hypothetical protein [Sphingopyxis sp.]